MATKTEQGQQKQGLWGKIQDWYAQPGIQMAVGMVYSIGAAVVIVGALFKIMHWPGAVSYTHLTLPTTAHSCRSRWSPYH